MAVGTQNEYLPYIATLKFNMGTAFRNTIFLLLGSILFISQFSISCKEGLRSELPDKIDFNFHIKPILVDRCYKCHGPDEKARKAGLRLDLRAGLFGKTQSGKKIIAPGRPGNSELIKHIYSTDPDWIMPPTESNLTLSAKEKGMITKWIDQGAAWKDHWAFLPIEQEPVPKVSFEKEIRNPIDQFIGIKLEQEGIEPSAPADPERLLRRIYLDLTGLPPSVEAMDEFLKNPSDEYLQSIEDKLLQTDAYAERMTMEWLDVARYADSHGYHADGWKSMYPWRDWVIKAFKENMPYDQFGTEQLAGDLLPNATEEQILATGFNRNHQITAEGGVIEEEYRMEYVFDRINTTSTAFLGLTMKCAQCHDHKFDPITQKEFYQFAAFFNNVDELGMNSDDGNCGPTILLLPDSSKHQLAEVKKYIEKIQTDLETNTEKVKNNMDYLNQKISSGDVKGLQMRLPVEKLSTFTKNKNKVTVLDQNPLARLDGQAELKDGYLGKSICLENEYQGIFLDSVGLFDRNQPFSAGVWIKPEIGKGFKTIFCNAGDKNSLWRGWDVLIDTSDELIFRIIHALPHDQLRIQSTVKIEFGQWQHVMVTYDGSGSARGMSIFLNGKPCVNRIVYDQLTRSCLPADGTFKPVKRALRLGRWNENFSGEIAFLKGCFDDIRIFSRQLSALEVASLGDFKYENQSRDDHNLMEYYLRNNDSTHRGLTDLLKKWVGKETSLYDDAVEVQVMDEDHPRTTYILDRGVYSEKKEKVLPGVPLCLQGMPVEFPQNRLGLARWIFSRDNPLTARVTVNRYWQMFFGRGIVATANDFGNQGALPSHPELLDWLALQLMEHHWDIKWLIKTIIESATYRRSSIYREDLEAADPQNILLARGPSFRLSAETIRDNALAASGLLVEKVGGEPVKPYQPDNIWGEKSFFSPKYLVYNQDTGANLYRRSMYTIIKRTSPPPAMMTFDGNDRSYCVVSRPTTNTPLQALILLNDPTYVEAARMLAQKVKSEQHKDTKELIGLAFRRLTGRKPNEKEMEVLIGLYAQEINHFKNDPNKANQVLSIGEYPLDTSWDPNELAALTIVNNTIMNHDESYMRR